MAVMKWFGRQRVSPVTTAMPSPSEARYPPPSYMAPSRGKMVARNEGTAAAKHPNTGFLNDCGVSIAPLPAPEREVETVSLDSSPPSTPRRDSATLVDLDEISTKIASKENTPRSRVTKEGSVEFQPRPSTPTGEPLPRPPLALSPHNRTWHPVVAAWKIMDFSQRHGLDLAYVIHICEDAGHVLPLSKFQTRHDATSPNVRFRWQFLAAYGLQNMSSPLQLPFHVDILQNGHCEYPDNAGPGGLVNGQICTYYRSSARPCHGNRLSFNPDQHNREVNRGIIFAAYRRAGDGTKICEKTVEAFIEDLIDLYLLNGLQSLLLDARWEGAERLGTTVDLGAEAIRGAA